MNRRHFLASVSATAIMPMRTFAAQDALRLKAEMVTRINNKSQNNTSKNIGHPGHLDTPIGVCPCLSGLGMSTDIVDMSAICPVRPGRQ